MFAADLSWTDHKVEKVGERKQRKENGGSRKDSVSSESTIHRSLNSTRSSSTSIRNGSITKSVTSSVTTEPARRPSTARSGSASTATAVSELRRKTSNLTFRDPAEQPDFTISAKFSPTLPSGGSF